MGCTDEWLPSTVDPWGQVPEWAELTEWDLGTTIWDDGFTIWTWQIFNYALWAETQLVSLPDTWELDPSTPPNDTWEKVCDE